MFAFGGPPSKDTLKLRELVAMVAMKKAEFYKAEFEKDKLCIARELLVLKERLEDMQKSLM